MLTKEIFDQIPNGEIFMMGILPNSPISLYMTNSIENQLLRWVAIKCYANDWSIYCHCIGQDSVEVHLHNANYQLFFASL